MVNPSLRTEMIRFRMLHLRQAAEHHRTRRRGDSPRRPDREHPEG
ncbi:MAG: hypothetical protein ACXWXB_01600 [Actinomycetota bacterium]